MMLLSPINQLHPIDGTDALDALYLADEGGEACIVGDGDGDVSTEESVVGVDIDGA